MADTDDKDWGTILENIQSCLVPIEAVIGPISVGMTVDRLAARLGLSTDPLVAGLVDVAEKMWPTSPCEQLARSLMTMAAMRTIARGMPDVEPKEDPSMSYGIWTTISGGVTGERAAWIISNGLELSFATKAEAQADVDRRRKQTSLHGGRTLTGQPIAHQTYEVRERPKRPS